MHGSLSPKEAEVAEQLHRVLTNLDVDFTEWQVECAARALQPVAPAPTRTVAEVEAVLEARTTENLHLRAEVARLKREDWRVRWVFESAARARAEARVEQLVESLKASVAALDSANYAAELARDQARRAEAKSRLSVASLFQMPSPTINDEVVEVTGAALYVDQEGA